jgi:hypothetical protein
VSPSTDILKVLKEDQKNGFTQVIAGNESWFYFDYFHQLVWVLSRDEIPERIKPKIDTEKCIISVIWSVNGIHSLLDVPKGTTHNRTFFCDVVVPDLHEHVHAHSRRLILKRVLMHLDNARLHNSKKYNECHTEFRARRVPHPAYSSDNTPSDFFLFWSVKIGLRNYKIHNRQDLILAIRAIFDEIPKDILNSVYVSWIKRLKWVIKNKEKYFSKWLKNEDFLFEFYPKTIARTFRPSIYWHNWKAKQFFLADFEMNLFFNTYNPDFEILVQKRIKNQLYSIFMRKKCRRRSSIEIFCDYWMRGNGIFYCDKVLTSYHLFSLKGQNMQQLRRSDTGWSRRNDFDRAIWTNLFVRTRTVPTNTFIEAFSPSPFEAITWLSSASLWLNPTSFVRYSKHDPRRFVLCFLRHLEDAAHQKLAWHYYVRWIMVSFIMRSWIGLAPSQRKNSGQRAFHDSIRENNAHDRLEFIKLSCYRHIA